MALDGLTALANTGAGTDILAGRSVGGKFIGASMLTDSTGAEITRSNGLSSEIVSLYYPVSTANATSTNLASGATFTGGVETILSLQAAQVMVRSDQPFTLTVYQYIDAGGTQQCGQPVVFTRLANEGLNENITLPGNYFKVTLQNTGASTTTNLVLAVTFGMMSTQPQALTNAGNYPVAVRETTAATASGNITTRNLVPAGTATAGSAVEITLNGASTLSIQTTGTYTGALSLQATVDGSAWVTLGGIPLLNVNTDGYLATITSALQGIFQSDVTGFAKARITGLAAITGTAAVTLRASTAPAMMALDAALPAGTNTIGTVGVTGYPTAAASADALANPTVTKMDATTLLFNGTSWDRQRNNVNTTTGDTGAKTATFAGATQTNFNARGASILINMGTVTGTTPTLTAQVQISPDGGTTWVNVPGAVTPTINASGTTLLTVYPGVTVAANSAISFPLSRTWRLNYTIGGTTPSFTITNVQVSYIK